MMRVCDDCSEYTNCILTNDGHTLCLMCSTESTSEEEAGNGRNLQEI